MLTMQPTTDALQKDSRLRYNLRNPGLIAYLVFMGAMILAVFVYEEQQRKEDRQFTERVCASLQEYRTNSNERREIIRSFFAPALASGVGSDGQPLTDEQRMFLETLDKGFSPIPALEDCDDSPGEKDPT
jgi:hypothetical protein